MKTLSAVSASLLLLVLPAAGAASSWQAQDGVATGRHVAFAYDATEGQGIVIQGGLVAHGHTLLESAAFPYDVGDPTVRGSRLTFGSPWGAHLSLWDNQPALLQMACPTAACTLVFPEGHELAEQQAAGGSRSFLVTMPDPEQVGPGGGCIRFEVQGAVQVDGLAVSFTGRLHMRAIL